MRVSKFTFKIFVSSLNSSSGVRASFHIEFHIQLHYFIYLSGDALSAFANYMQKSFEINRSTCINLRCENVKPWFDISMFGIVHPFVSIQKRWHHRNYYYTAHIHTLVSDENFSTKKNSLKTIRVYVELCVHTLGCLIVGVCDVTDNISNYLTTNFAVPSSLISELISFTAKFVMQLKNFSLCLPWREREET